MRRFVVGSVAVALVAAAQGVAGAVPRGADGAVPSGVTVAGRPPITELPVSHVSISPRGTNVSTTAVGAGDFDGDGLVDMVTTTRLNSSLTFVYGTGGGQFTAPVVSTLPDNPSVAAALDVADFDGDGTPDVVLGVPRDYLLVYLGTGTRATGAPIFVPVASFTSDVALAAGDVDGEGSPDLVTVTPDSGAISVLLGNGDGTFTPATPLSSGTSNSSVTLADVDGDGAMDLAVGSVPDSSVSVLLGDGAGGFAPGVTLPAPGFVNDVTLADTSGDGVPDLVTAYNIPAGKSGVTVRNGVGDGTFTMATTLATGGLPRAVLALHFDGDGRLDLALTSGGTPPLTSDRGTLAISTGRPGSLRGYAAAVRIGPSDLAAADLDGDGDPDIVTTNSSDALSVVFNPLR